MNTKELMKRITINVNVFGGKPILRGRRLTVESVLSNIAMGKSIEELIEEHPWLEKEDVQACLDYACRAVGNERMDFIEFENLNGSHPES